MDRVPRRRPAPAASRWAVIMAAVAAAVATVLSGCSDSSGPVSLPSGSATMAASPSGPGDSGTGSGAADSSGTANSVEPSGGAGTVTTGATPSVAGGTPHCDAARLTASVAGADGAAGTINVGIRVTNTGPGPCWTYGYPGLQILDQAGQRLPTFTLWGADADRFQRPQVADRPPQRVVLPGGAWGWFDVTYTTVPSPACPDGPRHGSRLAVIAPDTSEPMTLLLETSACHGDLGVSAVLPASTWPGFAPPA